MSIQTSTPSDGKGKTTNVRDIQKEGAAAELVAEMQDKKTGLKNTLHAIQNGSNSTKQTHGSGSGFDNRLYAGSSPSSFPNMHNNLNRKTICLNMIVKNEAHVIAETLENLYSYVKFDYYVICDTGSTDATKSIITNFFSEKGVAGEIHDHVWRDFGHNRTLALNAAYNKADYSFIFDADDKIVGDFELVQPLRSDSYHFKFGNGFNYLRVLMINSRQRWQFKGVLHEFITCTEASGTSETIQGNYYVESGRRGARNNVANKYLDDARILERGFHDEMNGGDKGMAERYAFYCAQSYKDGGDAYIKDAIQWYERVLTLNNWTQEKYYSCLMLAELYERHPDKDKSRDTLMKSHNYLLMSSNYDSERIEGVATLIEQYRNHGMNTLVNLMYHKYKGYSRNQTDKLFVNQGKYDYCIEYNNSISAFYTGDSASGYECCKQILTASRVPVGYYSSTINNVMFYKDLMMKDRFTHKMFVNLEQYIAETARNGLQVAKSACELWNALFGLNRSQLTRYTSYNFKNRRVKNVKVMLTFTTCKRYDLFQQTINSIINQWADVEDVDFWFCVDDNSSIEERNRMRKNYGWIRYYMKRPEQKGHRESMNIIYTMLKRIRPKYWIHMEDDFLFHTRMDYVTPAIKYLEALKESHGVRQVLFNRNYGETIDDYKILSHSNVDDQTANRLRDIDGGKGIKIGVALQDYRDAPNASYAYSNCHYWPHYSFRPALVDVEAVFETGDFNTENQFFEMDYAKKWVERGFKSAFFNRITNRHIGRLTSERHDKTISNAYELNNENQFQKKSEDVSKLVLALAPAPEDQDLDIDVDVDVDLEVEREVPASYSEFEFQERDIPIKIVNLKRRPDRREESISKLASAGIMEHVYEFVDAVDGAQIVPTPEMKRLFQGNDFGSKRGVIGCALSHYHLWKQLLADSNHEFYLIMEDDFDLGPHFKRAIHALHDECVNRDVIFMGYHMFSEKRDAVKHIYNRDLVLNTELKAKKKDVDPDPDSDSESNYYGLDLSVDPLNKDLYIGATHCYSVNKNGAKLLIQYIDANGIKHGIDYLMKIANNGLECYETQPHLALADWNESGKQIDTDIQFDYNCIDFDSVEEAYTFFPGLDMPENDMNYIGNMRPFKLNAWMDAASAVDGCVAFNTHGFLKRSAPLSDLCETPYINSGNKSQHGIYIRTDYVKFQKKYEVELVEARKNNQALVNCGNIPISPARPLRIGFHNTQLCDRGSTVAMLDYAHYNETILGNTSYVLYNALSTSNVPEVVASCQNRYTTDRVFGYTTLIQIEEFILENKLDAVYIIKSGAKDKYVFMSCPTLVHCVFEVDVHGSRYAAVSNYLKVYHAPTDYDDDRRKQIHVVPHMIDMPTKESVQARLDAGTLINYRSKLEIADTAFVVGRYGGMKQFNLYQVHNKIIQFLTEGHAERDNVYFVFVNTAPFYSHPRIKYVDTIYDKFEKAAFILSCDAMIHGRSDGETFGLSLGEFAFYNKPIITTVSDEYNAHVEILKNKAILYNTHDDTLLTLLCNLKTTVNCFMKINGGDVNGYAEYTPENVMRIFNREFLGIFKQDQLRIDTDIADEIMQTAVTSHTPTPTTSGNQSIRVKMICNWCSSQQLCKEWSNMCERNFKWKNIEITWTENRDEIDYYVIINYPLHENEYYVPEKTLVYQMEPAVTDPAKPWGTKMWGKWANPDPKTFMHVNSHVNHLNAVQWLFRYPLNQLSDSVNFKSCDKLDRISCILSKKNSDEGHVLRNKLLKYIETESPRYANAPINELQSFLNVFGKSNFFQYRAYIGKLPQDNPFYGIKSYKYYFMCENNSEHNYATEKIWEPILCETLCFYWGCPNLDDYIDSRAYVRLDVADKEGSLRIMEDAVKNDLWSQRIPYIRAAKEKILNELAFFPKLQSFIDADAAQQ
jgi:GR25 family glycosyltransferase involved in LPS biosynthesis